MFFSGFGLKDELELFDLKLNQFEIAGFSYGSIKAFELTLNRIKEHKRVNRLILLSPVFFEQKDEKFKKMQLIFFKKDKNTYIKNFLKNIVYPANIDITKYLSNANYDDLKQLLNYKWDLQKLKYLKKNGVIIEVYLGELDKIIDSYEALEFFKKIAEVYFVKNVGHILKDVK